MTRHRLPTELTAERCLGILSVLTLNRDSAELMISRGVHPMDVAAIFHDAVQRGIPRALPVHDVTIYAEAAGEPIARPVGPPLVPVKLPRNCAIHGDMSAYAELAAMVEYLLDPSVFPSDDRIEQMRARFAEIRG